MQASCVDCGASFESRYPRSRYCSPKCRYRARDRKRWPGAGEHAGICIDCGTPFVYRQVTKARKRCLTCAPPMATRLRKARLCKRCGAPTLTPRHHYCGTCGAFALARRAKSARARHRLAAARRQQSTTQRGYGVAHQKMRARWAKRVEAGAVNCTRCGLGILPGEPWDLGHDDFDRSRYTGPEHARCNRATAGRATRRRRPKAPRANWW